MEHSSASESPDTPFNPPVRDPWKGLRGVMAGTLLLEAIVVLLALPVVGTVGPGLTWVSGGYLVVLALLMIGGAGVQRRPWAPYYNFALQLLMIAAWFAHPAIGVLGLLFLGIWCYIYFLRRQMRFRIEHGLLPGQRD
ncbi:DUF4233 domain-containing protein [Skermania sp. ID1734]|uniref:DUF4233 domain-containing protein n=1 Tax=Skermania sp. ID1734 TaxID=2597516 RepID=UPI00117D2853|nr:DUF4233 domain-containing protein [Skermania sp. ID1734]TSE00174.1 DUF4233 domain-containing protein [Skermania sp. ID1734]